MSLFCGCATVLVPYQKHIRCHGGFNSDPDSCDGKALCWRLGDSAAFKDEGKEGAGDSGGGGGSLCSSTGSSS